VILLSTLMGILLGGIVVYHCKKAPIIYQEVVRPNNKYIVKSATYSLSDNSVGSFLSLSDAITFMKGSKQELKLYKGDRCLASWRDIRKWDKEGRYKGSEKVWVTEPMNQEHYEYLECKGAE